MRIGHFAAASSTRRIGSAFLAAAVAVGVVGCGGSDDRGSVTMLVYDSFDLPSSVIDEFHAATGITLKIAKSGDSGKIASQISLTPGSPKGDLVYGIDNTFAARPIEAGALMPYVSPAAANGASEYALKSAPDLLTAVSRGDVCLNIDSSWYERRDAQPPQSLDDLTKPAYRNQAALLDPRTSSPGISFLLTTIGQKRRGWEDYWRKVVANGATIVSGWEIAYNQLFSAGAGRGSKPIVVSYASSPVATPGTEALLETCFRQVEYAGILKGAANVDGARKVIDFLLGPSVQKALPASMFVYPVTRDTPLPDGWSTRAPMPEWTVNMPPGYIAKNREKWLQEWRDAVGR
ncbi:thiamine ABC transporter substrate-binding protein [Gordonia crocea]|uniref:Thiamine ABC transporter substrate-binding protein n=1 Tax=Gordonia crocea TaxID=589162 RepID=A0A7I9V046_9ACTN|nr:thiamine ABC transporter substrate-binding protein [Gordonia crocea]GED98792.1 thiamine ABC transporter substrate-binding protein [Gordonia crocea]GED98798.1 thiamine ABC transporter substrate-binding protein [Gordonia crocea]